MGHVPLEMVPAARDFGVRWNVLSELADDCLPVGKGPGARDRARAAPDAP